MVWQYEKVFERLMAGESLDKIRRDISGGSSLQRGIQMYIEEREKVLPELQREISDLERKRSELNDDLQRLSSVVQEAESTREELDRGLKARKVEVGELDRRIVEAKIELDAITSKLDALEERGVTEGAIARVEKIDFGSEDELLDRISTVEKFRELEVATRHLEEELADKTGEYEKRLAKLKSLEEAVASEKNELDEVQRRRLLHEKAYSVVAGFLDDGYDADLLLGILEPLRSLAVKGQPLISLGRLIDGLSEYRKLTELQEETIRKEAELAKLTRELVHTEATLITVKDTVLEVIEEAKDKSMAAIDRQGSEALKMSKSLKDLYTLHLDELEKGQIARSEQLSKKGEANIIRTQNEAMAVIRTLIESLRTTLVHYENYVRKWGEEKEEFGRLKDVMPYAKIVYDAREYKSNYENIPIDIISKFVHVLWLWIHSKKPNEKISPTRMIANEDLSISEYSSYKLTSMIDIIEQYFFP